jgi:FkbM family methyltransferase
MYLDPKDIAVVPHIILEGIWERQITEAWRRVMDEMDIKTVYDIGSNFGYFGMLAAQKVNKENGRVVLFEANPRLVPYIHKNLSVNWLNENTVVANVAVSDKNGTEVLNVLEDYTGSSSVHSMEKLTSYLSHKMSVKAEESVEIPAVTIDSYSKSEKIDTIDLIKMDIEGYEEKAYFGMRKMIKASPKTVLFIEFTKDGYDDPKALYDMLLSDFGHIYTINGEGGLEKPKKNSYDDIVVPAADWVMLVFSKTSLSFTAN